jgi:4-amino-4-deoxy-L-arabinose transferase-like glycosyltransferase
MYVRAAREVARQGIYPALNTLYPPLYSLAIVPAVLLGDDWYEWAIRINVLVSSTIVFPIWLIARCVLSRRLAMLCVVLAASLPCHVVYPRMLFSENLYFPLFLMAVYLVVAESSWSPAKHALLFGVVLGLCQLTRHIHLALLPVFVACVDEGESERAVGPLRARPGR